MQPASPAHFFDHSLAYLFGTLSVLTIGVVAFAIRANDFNMSVGFDEVKVEAAQFPFQPKSEMDIFAAGCNGKVAQANAQLPCRASR